MAGGSGSVVRAVLRGAVAGTVASVVQAAVGKTEDLLLLAPHESADIAPRLMARIAAMQGKTLTWTERWTLGTVFHLGYGAGWGKLYALARERRPVDPLLGGLLLAGGIYVITFPRWGGAVWTKTERPPSVRTRRMELVAASVTLAFGLTTAYLYEALRPDE
jgi:hypothetical protein